MSAVWMRVRIELRSRWREWLAVALFAGLAGGLVIAAAAGARRTDSALMRHLVAYRFPDAQVPRGNDSADNSDSYFMKTIAHVRTLPQVTASAETAELAYCARDRFNRPVEVTGPNAVLFTVNVDGRYGVSLRRPKLLSGRLPDPRRAREVLLDSRTAGRFGVEPGDVIPMRVFPDWTPPQNFTCDPLHEQPGQKGIPLVRGLRQILLACEGTVPCRRRKRLADRLYARLRNGASFARLVRRYSDFPDAEVTDGRLWISQGQKAAPVDRAAFSLPTGGLSRPIRTQFGWHIVQPTSNIVAIGPLIRLRVVGIAATTDPYPLGAATLTPAFHRRYWVASRYASYSIWVRLRHGAADLPALGAAAGEVSPQGDTTEKLQPSVHHQAQALWVAAAFGAVLGLLLVAPALLRLAAAAAADTRTLKTIGMTRAQLLTVDLIRAVAIGIVAAVASVAVAFAISPLTPIGVARELEPSPGFAFDVAAIVVGAAAVAVPLVLVGAFTSRRAPEVQPRRTGSAADTLARWRLPLTTISGVRLALAQGPRTSSVPTSATVLSATVAVAVVAVALTFTASLQHLFSTPRLYGQNWDYRTNYDVPRLARTDPSISDAAQGDEVSILVNGRKVTVSAMDDVKGRIGPVVTAGRPPVRTDELALSQNTLTALHLDVGDTVEAHGKRSARMRIVGRVVLPESVCDCPRPRGAMTFEAFKLLQPDSRPTVFEARIAADADRDATLARLQGAYIHPPPGPPKTVADFEGIRKLPVLASVLLAAIAAVALAHTLVTAIRRRRRHLAVLKTIGFDRRQVLATVTWQALTFAALGLLLGLPLGIAAGRWAWYLFARQIDVVPEPVTPVALILLLVPAAVLLAIVVAAAPAWSAAGTRAAVVLRAE